MRIFILLLALSSCATVSESRVPVADYNYHEISRSIQFSFDEDEVKRYPVIFSGFESAADAWAQKAPICVTIYIGEDNGSGIRVQFRNLLKKNTLGFWDSRQSRIVLNIGQLERNPRMAYLTALHEMGHAFGLQHFVKNSLNAVHGDLVTKDAEGFVMYPQLNETMLDKELQDAEVALCFGPMAKQNQNCFLTLSE
jgi:hypothetical protein